LNKSWKGKKTVGKELKKRKRQGGKFIDKKGIFQS
jgi:hypothetical protein